MSGHAFVSYKEQTRTLHVSTHETAFNPVSFPPQVAFDRAVDQGYQASQTWHQGAAVLCSDCIGCSLVLEALTRSEARCVLIPVRRTNHEHLCCIPVSMPHRGSLSSLLDAVKKHKFTDALGHTSLAWYWEKLRQQIVKVCFLE